MKVEVRAEAAREATAEVRVAAAKIADIPAPVENVVGVLAIVPTKESVQDSNNV